MIVVGGADEAVVGDVHELPQVQHALGSSDDVVHELLGGDAGLAGLVLDLLAVLIGAGQEHHVTALEPLIAGHGVGGHGAVGVADVQLVRGVVDRGGDIKLFLLFSFHIDPPSADRDAEAPRKCRIIFQIRWFFSSPFSCSFSACPSGRSRGTACSALRRRAGRGRGRRWR